MARKRNKKGRKEVEPVVGESLLVCISDAIRFECVITVPRAPS